MARVPTLCLLLSLSVLINYSEAIWCFECDSTKTLSCAKFLDPSFSSDCSHVSEAEYCVKMVGVLDKGKLGTKRVCSSRDLGNYCEYIKRPGDIQEYKSCVFSCTQDHCNTSSPQATLSKLATLFILSVVANQMLTILWD